MEYYAELRRNEQVFRELCARGTFDYVEMTERHVDSSRRGGCLPIVENVPLSLQSGGLPVPVSTLFAK